jgi:phytanoyl-CoA hydroxylase
MASVRERLDEDGFVVLTDFVTVSACDELRARAAALAAAFEPPQSKTIFSTRNQTEVADSYFLDSGDRIRFFFEEGGAVLNKIGHALHDLDPVFDRFSRAPAIARLMDELGFRDPLLIQSMFIFKPPLVGGDVRCHQDATFLYTDPLRLVGLWFALEDAHRDNGCLWAIPGGHRLGLKSRFVRDGQGGTRVYALDDTPFPEERMIPLEVERGTLILLDGLLPHRSDVNRSTVSRNAFTLHVIERAAAYPAENWLQRSLPARGF